MKTFQTLILFLITINVAFSQTKPDIIVKKDNTKIEALIKEVDDAVIKYKRFSNPDGPLFTIKKEEVVSILYANGEVEVIPQTPASPDKKTASHTPENQSAKIPSDLDPGTGILQRGILGGIALGYMEVSLTLGYQFNKNFVLLLNVSDVGIGYPEGHATSITPTALIKTTGKKSRKEGLYFYIGPGLSLVEEDGKEGTKAGLGIRGGAGYQLPFGLNLGVNGLFQSTPLSHPVAASFTLGYTFGRRK